MPPRLRRLLLTASRFCCMVVVLASLLLWARSCQSPDLLTHSTRDGRYYEVVTIPGQVRFTWARGWLQDASPWRWRSGREVTSPDLPVLGQRNLSRKWYLFGTGLRSYKDTIRAGQLAPPTGQRMSVTYRVIAIPLALPALLAALPFGWAILRRNHRRRLRAYRLAHRLCPFCAYDLRASAGRCPECGEPIPIA